MKKEDEDVNVNDKNSDESNETSAENLEIGELVDELCIVYPDIPRGTVYEAVLSTKSESFLTNYLIERQAMHTKVEGEMTLGDLFSSGDNREVKTIVGFGKKTGMSKPVTIAMTIAMALSRTIYNIATDDDVKTELDEIDITHSKNLLEKAKALTKDEKDEQKNEPKNKKETK